MQRLHPPAMIQHSCSLPYKTARSNHGLFHVLALKSKDCTFKPQSSTHVLCAMLRLHLPAQNQHSCSLCYTRPEHPGMQVCVRSRIWKDCTSSHEPDHFLCAMINLHLPARQRLMCFTAIQRLKRSATNQLICSQCNAETAPSSNKLSRILCTLLKTSSCSHTPAHGFSVHCSEFDLSINNNNLIE